MNIPELTKMNNGKCVENTADLELRRKELLTVLAHEEYGIMPEAPAYVKGEVVKSVSTFCGFANLEFINLTFPTPNGDFTMPVKLFAPANGEKMPVMIHINFNDNPYDKYHPAEEIFGHGYALGIVYYGDVTSDDGDFTNGIAAQYPRRNDGTDWGKISMWAFAASRFIDYLCTRPDIDSDNIAVAGHSRLGKTALWCGANDTRVKLACSNDSGCSGASLERYKLGNCEHFDQIYDRFPYWFCENFKKYGDAPETAPFDQHFLIGACAPRYVAVGSGELDEWACPPSEKLCAQEAAKIWEAAGLSGYSENPSDDAHIVYHIRKGGHFFSRTDWIEYMKFFGNIIEK